MAFYKIGVKKIFLKSVKNEKLFERSEFFSFRILEIFLADFMKP